MTAMQREQQWFTTRLWIEGVLLGAAYGLLFRFGMRTPPEGQPDGTSMNAMTLTFLVVVPIVMGFLTIWRMSARRAVPVWRWFVMPWITIAVGMLGALALYWEGAICVILALPLAMVAGSIGGVIAGAIRQSRGEIGSRTTLSIAMVPLLLAPVEARLHAPLEVRTVESQILLHASPDTIWRNVERVPAIRPTELRTTWTHWIGFPRPVEATLSYEGVGGVRHATFEHGLTFIETVTVWEPGRRIAFSIKADTAHIPRTTLDEHVTIGGPYFDVLDGEYRLEPLANGDTLLHLTSHQRLSTDVNGYAGLWSDAVMGSLQDSILEVIRGRCEGR